MITYSYNELIQRKASSVYYNDKVKTIFKEVKALRIQEQSLMDILRSQNFETYNLNELFIIDKLKNIHMKRTNLMKVFFDLKETYKNY